MNSEVVLLAAIPITSAILLAFLLPRLSRIVLGPLVIVASVVAAVIVVNRSDLARDAWGPALAVIAIFIGAVGIVSGLILIVLGGPRARRIPTETERSATRQPYSKENPYRVPGPGLFTPKRLFVFIVGATGVFSLIFWVYSWMV